MESLSSIKLRLSSIRNTKQITRALQMVSVSKMIKAQKAATSSSDYTESVKKIIRNVLQSVINHEDDKLPASVFHYVKEYTDRPILIVLFTPTKGFCGALVGNILRASIKLVKEFQQAGINVEFIGLQKKSKYIINKLPNVKINSIFLDPFKGVSSNMISGEVTHVLNEFLGGKYRKVILLYPKFINTFTYEIVSERILPVDFDTISKPVDKKDGNSSFIIEPDLSQFLSKALDKYIFTVFLNATLHTIASEHSSRMIAMKNATENAEKLSDDLQLMYNRIRQESITNELLDIVGGIITT